jgi:hypothetical protein
MESAMPNDKDFAALVAVVAALAANVRDQHGEMVFRNVLDWATAVLNEAAGIPADEARDRVTRIMSPRVGTNDLRTAISGPNA